MIYLDYSANTPADQAVLAVFLEAEQAYIGNPNATHPVGRTAKAGMDRATASIAAMLGVKQEEIIYTSGASESNNLALKGIAQASRHLGRHIISTALEHSSVGGTLSHLQQQGWEIDLLDITRDCTVDLEHLKELLRKDTVLVAVSAVDSELGTIQPIREISEIIKKYRKELWKPFIYAVRKYELVQAGDKIAVCISGGKDSMLMAKLMQELHRHSDAPFDLVFLVMDPGYNAINRQKIESNAALLHVPITIFETNIFAVANNTDQSPCYLCAKMRRGTCTPRPRNWVATRSLWATISATSSRLRSWECFMAPSFKPCLLSSTAATLREWNSFALFSFTGTAFKSE